ncbi:MAG: diphthamide biosynthesis enzyme Dph2 [Candidatus Methanomethyliales bacterium]|nr:diphthamide biosynthesis enzyme Dph2 [Candidatus Methanomethylicales archaeon]
MSNAAPYDLEYEKIINEIKSRGVRAVLIQAPDGLKPHLKDLWMKLSSAGITVYISADPCYGGCDLADGIGRKLGADMLIHIGHNKFVKTEEEIPTLYIPASYIANLSELVKKSVEFLKGKGIKRVGLVASLQHVHSLRIFVEGLRSNGFEVAVDDATGGAVLGCNVEAAKRIAGSVDAILHVGGGDFHALGVALYVELPVYIVDPYRGEIRDIEKLKRKILARRWWAIQEAKRAQIFGVVVVTKGGQFNRDLALLIKKELEAREKKALMLVADEVNWERLSSLTFVDSFIITGCPRISIDNQEIFGKPVLNVEDFKELLKVIEG